MLSTAKERPQKAPALGHHDLGPPAPRTGQGFPAGSHPPAAPCHTRPGQRAQGVGNTSAAASWEGSWRRAHLHSLCPARGPSWDLLGSRCGRSWLCGRCPAGGALFPCVRGQVLRCLPTPCDLPTVPQASPRPSVLPPSPGHRLALLGPRSTLTSLCGPPPHRQPEPLLLC